jgi:DNA topoisomerase VI subunit B
MALRAFHANPSIGGFGGESSSSSTSNTLNLLRPKKRSPSSSVNNFRNANTNNEKNRTEYDGDSGDAFCQIVKELVDNAVDAIAGSFDDDDDDDDDNPNNEEGETKRRIRVEIRPYKNNNNDDDDNNNKLLEVSVTDNGTGIENIKDCVNAFFSKKDTSNTSGRYGIGLTLCLIHAQRLVPNSYACITSTKKGWNHQKSAFFVVDTVGDSVVCHHEERTPKLERIDSSGTRVRLLVPVSLLLLLLVRSWIVSRCFDFQN